MKKTFLRILTAALCLVLVFSMTSCSDLLNIVNEILSETEETTGTGTDTEFPIIPVDPKGGFSLDDIPAFTTKPFVVINDNVPDFPESDKKPVSFEHYSDLDALGRCGVAYACVGRDLMPTSERESISSVHPTGWRSVSYSFINGKSLYNRCHLIAFKLAGENANEKNLITGTRYLNEDAMIPFEDMVEDFVKEDNGHVLYRVTPIFVGNELVARGVQMEGWSVEDKGESVCFNVFCYNCQPCIAIDYMTGESHEEQTHTDLPKESFALNTNSKKFHKPDCPGLADVKSENVGSFNGARQCLIDMGYTPCKTCNP